jgi:2-polyprenyl-3-methyl-5-hydroxy-6-metoxy-1,4-benzoquinol methylase
MTFSSEGDELRDALDKIAKINQLLGGNKLTFRCKRVDCRQSKNEITIVDVGCGNGDMLRTLADYGLQHNIKFNLIGVDANNFTVKHAINLSKMYPNISYHCEDIFDKPEELKYDIVFVLTLHHFKDEEIIKNDFVFMQMLVLVCC